MVRKVWMAILALMMFAASAMAEDLTVQLVVKPSLEPYPALTWKSDFKDAVAVCRGNDLTVVRDADSGVTLITAPNTTVAGYATSAATLILSGDTLGAVYYEIDEANADTFATLKACYSALYGEQSDSSELFEPAGRLYFSMDGLQSVEAADESEEKAWWEKAADSVAWTLGSDLAEACTWEIDGHTLLTLQYYAPNTFMSGEDIIITFTKL